MNIREKINLKHESVSLDDRKENEQNGPDDGADFKNEVIIKSGVINVKDEVARMATPKILGKIDLSDNHKKKNTAAPATPMSPATATVVWSTCASCSTATSNATGLSSTHTVKRRALCPPLYVMSTPNGVRT